MHRKTKLCFFLAIFMCLILVVQPTPTQATSYTTTDYDFYGVASQANTNDNEIAQISGTINYGIWQPFDDDVNGSHYTDTPLTKWVIGGQGTPPWQYGSHANTTVVYQGNASIGLTCNSSSAVSVNAYKKYKVGTTNFDPHNIWLMGAIYLNEDGGNLEFGHIQVQVQDNIGAHLGAVDYYVYNTTTAHNDNPTADRVRLGNNTNQWYYVSRNVTQELVDSGGSEMSSAQLDNVYYIQIKVHSSSNPSADDWHSFYDSLLLVGHEDANFPEPVFDAGDPTVLYSPTGLNITSDADDKAYVRCDFDDFTNREYYGKKIVYATTPTPSGTPVLSSSLNIDDAGWSVWNRTLAQMGNDTWRDYSTIETYSGENIDGRYFDLWCEESEIVLVLSLGVRVADAPSVNGGNGDNGNGGTGDGGNGGNGDGDGGVTESLKIIVETNKRNYYWGDFIYVDVYLIYAKDVSSEYVRVAFDDYEFEYAEKIEDKHYQIVFDTTLYVLEYGEHVIYIEAKTNVHDLVSDTITISVVQFLGPVEAIENFLYAGGSLLTIIRVALLGGLALIAYVFGKFFNTYLKAVTTSFIVAINGFLGWIAYYLQVEFWPSFLTFGDIISNFMWFLGLIAFSLTIYTLLKRRREEKHSGILT